MRSTDARIRGLPCKVLPPQQRNLNSSGTTLIRVVDGSAVAELRSPAREFLDYVQGIVQGSGQAVEPLDWYTPCS